MSAILNNGKVWRPPVATLDGVLRAAAGVADLAALDRLIDDVGRTLEAETLSRSEATLALKALERASDRLEGPASGGGPVQRETKVAGPTGSALEYGRAVSGARLGR